MRLSPRKDRTFRFAAVYSAVRKVFGAWRTQGGRDAARQMKASPARRRASLFESLEQRLLLSADPAGTLGDDGVLRLILTEADDAVVVSQVGTTADGGARINVTLAGITETFGDDGLGVASVVAAGLDGDDRFAFLGLSIGAAVDGGDGSDTLFGPSIDATWMIDGADRGSVSSVDFTSVENLAGAADNKDSFELAPGASVSGLIDGGAGGFDALSIQGGNYQAAIFTATGPDSGTVALDGTVIQYAGLEPITLGGTATDVVINLTAVADSAELRDNGSANDGMITLDSLNGTFEDTTFAAPTGSLTIALGLGNDTLKIKTLDETFAADLIVDGDDGADQPGDTVTFESSVSTHGGRIDVTARTINVNSGVVLSTRQTAAGADQETAASTGDSGSHPAGRADGGADLPLRRPEPPGQRRQRRQAAGAGRQRLRLRRRGHRPDRDDHQLHLQLRGLQRPRGHRQQRVGRGRRRHHHGRRRQHRRQGHRLQPDPGA